MYIFHGCVSFQDTYNIIIVATDNGADITRSSTALFTLILVDNTNLHSPMLDRTNYTYYVSEDQPIGYTIFTVTASDGDDAATPAGQIANFTLTGGDSVYFRVVQNETNNFLGHVILK